MSQKTNGQEAVELIEGVVKEVFAVEQPLSVKDASNAIVVGLSRHVVGLMDSVDHLAGNLKQSNAILSELYKKLADKGVDVAKCTDYSEAIDQLCAIIAAENKSESVVHHHWHTPTEVEVVGNVLKATPVAPKADNSQFVGTLVKLAAEDKLAQVVNQLESDLFSRAMSKLTLK
ncbi:hypothetical protein KYLE_18 [Pantoea phage Kyle]|uniref:Uncharacterized protein n=1 Tax=Pantoea phage Kyle TaxID=2589665 RepID=A0A514A8R0_9CAUD|nr:hypothetical protein HWC52_gp018 [Pantoea phage Kyle]QDH49639.1 hypothetical protein KYLE_18 [Pantoea phage Kyle]